MALKDYNASLRNYSWAIKIQANKTAAWLGLVKAYSALDNYVLASEAASNITQLEPKNKANWIQEGNLLQQAGSFDKAIAKYDSALALDSNNTDALYRKGVCMMAVGNLSAAISLFDRVLVINPQYKYAYNAKGLALEAEGKYPEALDAYDQSVRIDPAWGQPAANKIHPLMALKKLDEAMKMLM
jgi:tetratricopeptide (TPR) repeat protein